MISLKNKESGFTIVELLIVIVIIGILAGLVITQFLGANQQARDSERKTDLNSLASQLEVYFAKSAGYPTLTNVNTAAWRTGNQFNAGDNGKALADPVSASSAALVAAVAPNEYSYVPTPAGCTAMTDDSGATISSTTPCTGFTLTAVLENTKDKSATIVGTQAQYVKKGANDQ